MELTLKQEKGLRCVIDRYRAGEKYTVISGFAGSGKSTLIKFIIAAFASEGIDPEKDVCNVAFTGKATTVLQKNGNLNCMTLHKLLYKAVPLSNGKYLFQKKTSLEYKIIIVDECSMLSQDMVNTLLAHDNIYVLFCGDPFQLPPIDKANASHLLDRPHVFLDEIMRQAKESEIIRLSMDIREGKSLKEFDGKDVKIFHKSVLNTGMFKWALEDGLILCATNATRIAINNQCRKLLGYSKPIEENEKIIFLRNKWDILNNKGYSLTNGVIGNLNNWYESYVELGYGKNKKHIETLKGSFIDDDGYSFGELELDKQCLVTGTPKLSDKEKYFIPKKQKDSIPLEATYGYCLTVHKVQGSQARRILGIEENFPYGIEHYQHLYTMLTRAEEKAVIIMKD